MSRLSPLNRRGPRQRLQLGFTNNPTGFAICQGCGLPTMRESMRERMEFKGGMTPQGTGLWVCANCDDVPNPFFQLQVLRPDPEPIHQPFPDINQEVPGNIGLEDETGEIELEDDSGVIELEDGSVPVFDV